MKLYTKDGKVSSLDNIILIKDSMQVINPTEEQVLADGWTVYEPEPYVPQPKLEPDMYEMVSAVRMMAQPQLLTLPDNEAIKMKALYDPWASKIGKEIKKDNKVYYDDKLFKARQDINSHPEAVRNPCTRKSTRPTRVRLKTPSRITTTWSWRKANTTFRTASPTSVRGTRT